MTNATGAGALIGFSEEAASSRLREEGYNELPSSKRRSIVAIALEVIREPMFLLLVACGTTYLILGRGPLSGNTHHFFGGIDHAHTLC
jgi:P-type Ca2+ transporter type 2C